MSSANIWRFFKSIITDEAEFYNEAAEKYCLDLENAKDWKIKRKLANSLKVHKRENFLGFDFEICTFS